MIDESTIAALDADEDFYKEVGDDIWIMDNHRWAFLIWKKYGDRSGIEHFSLVHADYHWDGVNDFYEQPEKETELLTADTDCLAVLVNENKLIRYDSFIAPAILIGLISEVHFYCLQGDETDEGIDENLLKQHGCQQVIHRDYKTLSKYTFKFPVIFDLCLDLFNRSQGWYEGDLWSNEEIDGFFEHMKPVIQQAALVTVSMSFGYSGTVEDTRRLTKFVLPKLWEMRRRLPTNTSRATR